MSKYTIQLTHLIEANYDLGLKEYIIFDENYRKVLNKKILDHYKFYEIGMETPELFKHYLNITMNEIMPYYNAIYKYQLSMLSKDIFVNFDQTEELTRNVNGTSDSTSNSTSSGNNKNKNLRIDTPQGNISSIVATELENQTFGTEVDLNNSINSNAVNDTSSVSSDNTENYTKHITGNIGARYYPEVMEVFIKNLMNIDLKIIDELQSCFMQIY